MDQAETLRQKVRAASKLSGRLLNAKRRVQILNGDNPHTRTLVKVIESECQRQQVKEYLVLGQNSPKSDFEFTTDLGSNADDILVVINSEESTPESVRHALHTLTASKRLCVIVNQVTSSEAARGIFLRFESEAKTRGWAEIHYLGHVSLSRSGNRILPLLKWKRDQGLPEISKVCVQWIAKRLNELMKPQDLRKGNS